MQQLNGLITEALLPAFEAAALEQAAANFAGTYVSARTNDSEPMLIHIVAGDGGLGLGVQNWTAGNLDLLKSYFAATAEISPDLVTGEPSLRLYPVNLHDDGRTAYRGVFEYEGSVGVFSTNETSPFGSHCAAWAAVSTPQYGNIGLDDFVFHVDETGRAIAVTARGARTELKLEDK
jgi:hypothetical protein